MEKQRICITDQPWVSKSILARATGLVLMYTIVSSYHHKVSHSRRPFQPFAVPDEKSIDEMGMLDAVRSPLSKFIDGGLHVVAKSFDKVADDEKACSVESCVPHVSALSFLTAQM